ncbi:MAG: 4Fe-4S dicluster domain-containing protein [Gemmatimonadota bacterium]|nr:MAG: 4Fe-4S dicluster domain-containing protein [Gemmatimonadota bacterium]
MRPSFVFDQNKCTGCQACQLACVIENELEPDASWRAIHTFNERHYPGVPLFHITLACNHCAEPTCMAACPALAYSNDSETGAVITDENKCIGCRYCTWACPYDAPKFDRAKGVISKCTFCNHRISNGSQPACVELCPTGALKFDRLPDAEIVNDSPGFTATDMGPSIKIIPLRESRASPEVTAPITSPAHLTEADSLPSRIAFRSEWPLAVFTLVGAVLFSLVTGVVTTGLQVSPVVFSATSVAAIGLTTIHLGRRERAWRATLNLVHSWLSREIVFFSLFVPLSLGYLLLSREAAWPGWLAVTLGAGAVLSMDMVYKFACKPRPKVHSAGVFLTGLFLLGVMTLNPVLAGLTGSLKLVLYLWRKTVLAANAKSVRPIASAIRLGVGFGVPLVLSLLDPIQTYHLIVASVLLGESVDRAEFYAEIEIMTPERQMALDLDAEIRRM